MCLVPLTERSGVDLNDGRLGKGVCADEFVVGRMEGYADNPDFARYSLGAPGEVARVETEGAVFLVSTTSTDEMNTFGADTGVGWLTTFFECSEYCC